MSDPKTEKSSEEKKIDWTKTATILKGLETRKFYGEAKIIMVAGEPKFVEVNEKIKVG